MCDKAVDYFLPVLKFVLDWFFTSNMINLDDVNFDEDDPKTIIHIRLMTCELDINNECASTQ